MALRPPRLVKREANLVLSGSNARIAVVADTHSQPHAALQTHLAAISPAAILHAGDIGEPRVIDELAETAPVFAVRGNIDGRAAFPDILTIDVTGERALRILLIHIAVNGPRLRGDVARLARAERASLVICGHSHVPFIGRDRELVVFNPGSSGPRRFHLPIVFGAITVGSSGIQLGHVDCETGKPWSPPS